jgi:hypothetical protein
MLKNTDETSVAADLRILAGKENGGRDEKLVGARHLLSSGGSDL